MRSTLRPCFLPLRSLCSPVRHSSARLRVGSGVPVWWSSVVISRPSYEAGGNSRGRVGRRRPAPASRTRPKAAIEDRRGDTTAQQLRDPGKADAAALHSHQGAVTGEDVAQAVGLPAAQRLGRRTARTSPVGEATVPERRGLVLDPAAPDRAAGRGLLVRNRRAGRSGVNPFQGLPPAPFGRPSGGRGPAGGLLGP